MTRRAFIGKLSMAGWYDAAPCKMEGCYHSEVDWLGTRAHPEVFLFLYHHNLPILYSCKETAKPSIWLMKI